MGATAVAGLELGLPPDTVAGVAFEDLSSTRFAQRAEVEQALRFVDAGDPLSEYGHTMLNAYGFSADDVNLLLGAARGFSWSYVVAGGQQPLEVIAEESVRALPHLRDPTALADYPVSVSLVVNDDGLLVVVNPGDGVDDVLRRTESFDISPSARAFSSFVAGYRQLCDEVLEIGREASTHTSCRTPICVLDELCDLFERNPSFRLDQRDRTVLVQALLGHHFDVSSPVGGRAGFLDRTAERLNAEVEHMIDELAETGRISSVLSNRFHLLRRQVGLAQATWVSDLAG